MRPDRLAPYGRVMDDATTTEPDGPTDRAHERFEIDTSTAEMYEQRFVPAIFATWSPRLLDAALVRAGQHVLDVACGTGIVARTALDRVGPAGSVTGVDRNPAMLGVAGRIAPDISWRQGDVADLPFDDGTFDVALCQMAMMFFSDRPAALREMGRVTRRGGTTATLVPASLDAQPAYRVFVDLAADLVGAEARSLLGTYWSCGDAAALTGWHDSAGLHVASIDTAAGPARFADPEDFVRTEVEASPLSARIDRPTLDQLCRRTAAAMEEWRTAGGFEIPLVCHTVVAHTA